MHRSRSTPNAVRQQNIPCAETVVVGPNRDRNVSTQWRGTGCCLQHSLSAGCKIPSEVPISCWRATRGNPLEAEKRPRSAARRGNAKLTHRKGQDPAVYKCGQLRLFFPADQDLTHRRLLANLASGSCPKVHTVAHGTIKIVARTMKGNQIFQMPWPQTSPPELKHLLAGMKGEF